MQGMMEVITEMDRICLVLFDTNNRIFGPYLAPVNRMLIGASARVTLL
jgi:hypothetical protein